MSGGIIVDYVILQIYYATGEIISTVVHAFGEDTGKWYDRIRSVIMSATISYDSVSFPKADVNQDLYMGPISSTQPNETHPCSNPTQLMI